MKIKIIAFGIAKDILGSSQLEVEMDGAHTIIALKKKLLDENPEFEKLRSLRFAVNEEYCSEDYRLKNADEVVIIPPVSGG